MPTLNFSRSAIAATLAALICVTSAHAAHKPSSPTAPSEPKLVLVIVVDQFRQDYTTRFRSEFTGGLKQMLSGGAVFADAHQDHAPTVTAPGHTTVLTGSVPATSGIVGNEWFDRDLGHTVTSVEDPSTTLIGDPGATGASPHNLVVTTVGDELRIAHGSSSHVVSLSMKDRAAILMGGRMADAAYWFDPRIGGFVSSSWYRNQLPDWMERFNAQHLPQRSLGKSWRSTLHPGTAPFVQLPAATSPAFYAEWSTTPFSSEVLENLAETALREEQLGRHATPDLLAVSFSANDALGHHVGPDAPEVEEMSVQTDGIIGTLIHAAEQQVGGPQNLLVVFTADHGVAPLPETNIARKLPGQRFDLAKLSERVRSGLRAKFGDGDWILSGQGLSLYLNRALITQHHLEQSAVEEEAARVLAEFPGVARVYTRHEFLGHLAFRSGLDDYMARGFFAPRSGDVFILMQPYFLEGATGTSHGTPYDYDSHVPLIFYDWNIRPGVYVERTGISDVAPTLATILHVETPSGSIGHVLSQVFRPTDQATVARPPDKSTPTAANR